MGPQELVKAFEKYGLKVEVVDAPFVRAGNDRIFQMDIPRKIRGNRREEWFRIYPGKGTSINVTNGDKKLGQIVLAVKEGMEEFDLEVPSRFRGHPREEFLRNNGVEEKDIFKRDGKEFVRRKTKPTMRHFLCGVDERQLFIATLPARISTVREAHASLKTSTVTFHEGKAHGRTIRQGEWFFVNCTEAELRAIKATIGGKRGIIMKKESLGSGGKPHVADEVIHMPAVKLEHGFSVRAGETFVRGKVRHADHKTVSFKTWRRVIRNNEGFGGSSAGIGWVD